MTGCRIGRVKLKGGATVLQLPPLGRDEAQQKLVSRAAMISSFYKPGEIHGYVVFAWAKDGASSVGYYINHDGVVSSRMLPSFTADALRDRMIIEGDWG